MNDQDPRWCRFWRELLEPIFQGTLSRADVPGYLRELTLFRVRFPDGELRRPSMRELRRAMRAYGEHGFGEWEGRP